jgi:hypothetical protein
MVNRYIEAFHLSPESPREALQEPTEFDICKLFAAVWQRCEKTLTTPRSRYDFLRCYLFRSGLQYDFSERGILLYEPGLEPMPAATENDGAGHGLDDDDGDVL